VAGFSIQNQSLLNSEIDLKEQNVAWKLTKILVKHSVFNKSETAVDIGVFLLQRKSYSVMHMMLFYNVDHNVAIYSNYYHLNIGFLCSVF